MKEDGGVDNMGKKLTIAQLIKDKEKLTNKKEETIELYLSGMDTTVVVKEIDDSLALEALEMGKDGGYTQDEYALYNIMIEPNLKDKELQDAYDVKEPMDIVRKIFDLTTTSGIVKEAMKISGFDNEVTVVDKVKK